MATKMHFIFQKGKKAFKQEEADMLVNERKLDIQSTLLGNKRELAKLQNEQMRLVRSGDFTTQKLVSMGAQIESLNKATEYLQAFDAEWLTELPAGASAGADVAETEE